MAKVEMLTTAAGPEGVWIPGQVVEVAKATAEALIAGGYAKAAGASGDEAAAGYSGSSGRRSVAELKAALAERGLPTTGRKAELIARLDEAEEHEEPSAEPEGEGGED